MGIDAENRITWIDSLKFIACFIVFLGHYCSAFYFSIQDTWWLGVPIIKLFYAVIFGTWWVYVFCILSGWLATKKSIKSFRELLGAFLYRYLRFVLPVLIGIVVVWVIWRFGGFQNYEVGLMYSSDFLMDPYQQNYCFMDTIKSAILLTNQFIGPLWVLRDIFAGTCLIYAFNYIRNKSNMRTTFALGAGFLVVCAGLYKLYPLLHSDLYYTLMTTVGGIAPSILEEREQDFREGIRVYYNSFTCSVNVPVVVEML